MKNIAIVLAGGVGKRSSFHVPKQFIKVAGEPIIVHTVKVLQNSEDIDEIIVLTTKNCINKTKSLLPKSKYPKISLIRRGGATRSMTSQIAIANIPYKECNLLFHDAVRPLLSKSIIHKITVALKKYSAVDVAIPASDTIIEINDNIISNVPDRSRLMRGQTPQAFRKTIIEKAYEYARKDPNFKATDDCGVVLKYLPEVPIFVVNGEEQNMKLTYPIDIHIIDKLFQTNSINTDTLPKDKIKRLINGKTIIVFGGGSGIGKKIVEISDSYGANVMSFDRSTTKTDIRNENDIKSALETTQNKYGKIDYIVNTAGVLNVGPLSEIDIDSIKSTIEINYMAPIIIAKMSLPYLEKTHGQLLFFTSSSYTRGRENYCTYSSSKAAIVNLTQALAEEWFKKGVRVNCINPERTLTPMRLKAFGLEDPKSLLKPEAVAKVSINILLSTITGQVIDVRRHN